MYIYPGTKKIKEKYISTIKSYLTITNMTFHIIIYLETVIKSIDKQDNVICS